MKVSKYNKIIKNGDKDIVFNSITCALAEVDERFWNIYDNIETLDSEFLEKSQKEVFDNMISGGYLVNDNIDELQILEYNYLSSKFVENNLALTIAPTLECNFACPYCYETPKNGYMSEEIQDAIIDLVKNRINNINSLSITWYGGEPVLGKEIIISLSEQFIDLCEKNEVVYNAFIITNGYLLNNDIIDTFKKLKINGYQITVDGPPEIHNKRRKFKNANLDTFSKIIENIKILKSKEIDTHIRVNIDDQNKEYIEELLEILQKNDLNNLSLNLGHVRGDTGSGANVKETLISNKSYADIDYKNHKLLKKYGFSKGSTVEYYPNIKANYCGADSMSSFVIDGQGLMYKCWNDIGEEALSIGNVFDVKEGKGFNDYRLKNNINYMMWSPFKHEKCKECWILPICMGGCPYNGIRNNYNPECDKWKYTIEEALLNKHEEFFENKEEVL